MMYRLLTHQAYRGRYWYGAVASMPLGVLLWNTGESWVYTTVLTIAALACASSMAIGDLRTGLLRNAWTAPLATAAAGQVAIALTHASSDPGVITVILVTLTANTGLYLAMGLMMWVGFGDVKFIIGLSLIAALLAGWMCLLLGPLAVILSPLTEAVRRSSSIRRPHGPALVCSLVLILLLSFASGNRSV